MKKHSARVAPLPSYNVSELNSPVPDGASRSSVIQCKPGGNCPSRHRGMTRQLSPLSVAEDSAAPILELQNRSPSGICRHSRVERQSRSGEGTQTHTESSSQEAEGQTRCQSCTSAFLKLIWRFLIILSVSSSWVGTTQFVKITYETFDCPFFMTWFSTNWNIMVFPIYYSGHLATAQEKQSPIRKFRECSRIFGEDGLTLKLFLKRTAPFSILWTLTNYLYLLALKKLTATDVSALFCCNKAFVFLLSWIVLKDRFMGARIVAAIMAITGIVMMAYADGFQGDSIIGVAYAVGSASTSALYKVLFKMFLGSPNFGEAAHFVSTLGFFNLIFISVTPIILYFTKVEYWSPFSAVPWGYLCGVAGLWLAFNILVNVGVVLTYPILISIGTVLSVPGNAAVDLLKHKMIFSVVRLGATIIICIGFLLMLLPEEWDEITLRFINSLKEKKSEDHADDITDSSVHTRSRSRANGPLSLNTVPEKGETSIIKQHPPRRPQRLEPAGPLQAIAPAKPWSQQEVAASPKPKALEKKGQSLRHLPGRRQHLHKLQMLDLTRRRQEAELKRNLHRDANINKQKIKEFNPKKVLDSLQRDKSTESRDLVPAEHNQRFHGDDHGNMWDGGLSRQHDEGWRMRELRMRDLFWDTSSTGSEDWEREEKIYRKPTLVRTKTERVSLFDDFFDRDF